MVKVELKPILIGLGALGLAVTAWLGINSIRRGETVEVPEGRPASFDPMAEGVEIISPPEQQLAGSGFQHADRHCVDLLSVYPPNFMRTAMALLGDKYNRNSQEVVTIYNDYWGVETLTVQEGMQTNHPMSPYDKACIN